MKNVLIIILLTIPIFANSQNWNLFNYNQKSYYSKIENNGIITETFKMDSIKTTGETEILYFNRNIGLSEECYNNIIMEQYNWYVDKNPDLIDSLITFGDSLLYISDYLISEKDTFIFLPKSEIGDSWITTKNNIQITCTDKRIENILGIEDSVKIFNINTSPYSDVEFILSKTFGLIKFLPFWKFTYQSQPSDLHIYYNLIGYKTITENVGYFQPEFSDYFHLHQGDKLFWKDYYYSYDITISDEINYYIDSLKYSFLSNDSVFYQINRKIYNENGVLSNIQEITQKYTVHDYCSFLNSSTSFFGIIPSQFLNDYNDVFNSKSLNLAIVDIDTLTYYSYGSYGLMIDTLNCETNFMFDWGYENGYSTREGFVYSATGFMDGGTELTLRGSIIDGIIYGNTTIPTIIEDVEKQNVSIYPNPSNGQIKINSSEKIISISIFDISGKQIIQTENNEIDFFEQKSGIYIIKVKTEKDIYTRKILINK